MEKLMELARRVSDQVEIYSLDGSMDGISFENAKLKDIESKAQSGLSLRILKDGKLGFAYTKNLLNREEFLQNAVDSLKGGVEGLFDLPLAKNLPPLDTYDPSIEDLSNGIMVEECTRICDIFSSKTDGQINVSAVRKTGRIRLINSLGTDLSFMFSIYVLNAEILFPGSYASIHRPFLHKAFEKAPDSYLNFILDLYNQSSKEAQPGGGAMKVLFLPETIYTLMGRVQSATNGKNIYQKTSPVLEKVGEKIFDEKLTIFDEPINDTIPGARAFDDEGIPCQTFPVIDSGVLVNFYYDLHYAKKMNASPTGHGYKGTISSKPYPSLNHLTIRPGDKPFGELLTLMDTGIIVAGVMGAHSGNILNGDFSVGLSPGLYVENGEIVGHVKDAMVAGNIFHTFQEVIAIEDTLHPHSGGTFPAILFDHVSVATRN